jgi:hypothetical protein
MATGTYNFDLTEIADKNFKALYTKRRRDALFAFTITESDGSVILGRDHLGAIPLYYRVINRVVLSSVVLADLVKGDEHINEVGLTTYIALGTTKLVSPFVEILCVPAGTVIQVLPSGETKILYEYTFTSERHPWWSLQQSTDYLDSLLRVAAQRALFGSPSVGLYLSGGVDSGITGKYLTELGATVHAYTTTPWGVASAEGTLAANNAERIGVKTHALVPFDTTSYGYYADTGTSAYANPCGATSLLAISCIVAGTPVRQESHIFFAQNADTATGSVADQSLLYFASFIPTALRKYAHRLLTSTSLMDNFVALRTSGLLAKSDVLKRYDTGTYSRIELLTLAGMLFGHTPVDGDIVIQPSLKAGQRIANIFYDVDVIEFLMGLPIRHRIGLSRESKFGFGIIKRILKRVAIKFLSDDVVNRKKGLTVPLAKDTASKEFFARLPTHIGTRSLTLPHHRFAAKMLYDWSKTLRSVPPALSELFVNYE